MPLLTWMSSFKPTGWVMLRRRAQYSFVFFWYGNLRCVPCPTLFGCLWPVLTGPESTNARQVIRESPGMIFASVQRRNDRFESSWRLWGLEALDLVTGAQLESGHGTHLKPLILTIPKKSKTIYSRYAQKTEKLLHDDLTEKCVVHNRPVRRIIWISFDNWRRQIAK